MNAFWENVLSGGISGVVSGAIVGFVLFYLQRKIENDELININLGRLKKRLPSDIIKYITPGSNLDKIKESLGEPDIHYNFEVGNFTDPSDPVPTNSYLYKFLNANLKITSLDDISVNTVSIFITEKTQERKYKIELPFPINEGKIGYLGSTKLTLDFLETIQNHTFNRTVKEMIWGIETNAGWASNYLSYSYFGYYLNQFEIYEKSQDPKKFIGAAIDGICISNIEGFAPSISIYE